MTERIPLFEEDKDYIDEDHISEFAKALIWQDDYDYDANTTATTDTTTTPINDEVPGIFSSLPSTNGNNKNKNKDINGTVSDSSLITDEDIMNSSYFDKPHLSTNLKSNSTKNDDDDDDDDELSNIVLEMSNFFGSKFFSLFFNLAGGQAVGEFSRVHRSICFMKKRHQRYYPLLITHYPLPITFH